MRIKCYLFGDHTIFTNINENLYQCFPLYNIVLPTPRDDGVLVPLGPGVDTGVHNPHGYTLNYNGKGVIKLLIINYSLDTVMLLVLL